MSDGFVDSRELTSDQMSCVVIIHTVEFKIIVCHRSCSDPFWYKTDQIQ